MTNSDRGIAAARWIEPLRASVPKARSGDPKAAHRLRVALGRLRVWLRLGGWRVLDDDLAWIRRKVGAVRDCDVGLARSQPDAVITALTLERPHAQRELERALATPRLDDAIAALSSLPAILPKHARRRTARLAKRALRGGAKFFDADADWHALHTERRAIRRLRYALDWLDACPPQIVELVDALGALGDVWLAREQAEHARDGAYRRQLEGETVSLTRAAVRQWQRAQPLIEEIAAWTST